MTCIVKTSVCAFILLSGASANDGKDHPMISEERNVQEVVNTMTGALMKGDNDTVMSTYGEGAIVLFEPANPVGDRAQIMQMFTELSMLKPDVTYSRGHEVYVAEDVAVHIAPWSMTGTTTDGQTVTQGGLSVAILKKQSDGSWKIMIDNPHGTRLLEE